MYRAFFVIPPYVHLLDISGPIHIFYEAQTYDAPIETYFLSLNHENQTMTSAGVGFNRLHEFSAFQLNQSDWLFIPGLEAALINDPAFEHNNASFYAWMREQYANGAKICSVCTGAYLLGQAGLLDGKPCTTHWKYLDDFRKQFPKTLLLNDRLFVKSDNLYSSAGVSSGIDLALYLLEETFGPVFATQIAKEVVVFLRRTEDDPQLSVFLQYRNHLENRVHQVQDYLSAHLDQKTGIDALAAQVNMSPRNLTRLFKKTTGITIGDYLDKLRVERAVQLLSEGHKVGSAANSCGLNSSNQLRTLLKKYAASLPSDLLP
jgi:transcriptional regulator GlxA family with amidase domain